MGGLDFFGGGGGYDFGANSSSSAGQGGNSGDQYVGDFNIGGSPKQSILLYGAITVVALAFLFNK